MAIDYPALAAIATALVKDAGAAATFVQLNQAPANPAEPWRGATDPETGQTEVSGFAVRVEPSSAVRLGLRVQKDGFVKRSEAILVAVADSDIKGFDRAVFDGVSYHIEGAEELNPAGTNLLYFVGVRR